MGLEAPGQCRLFERNYLRAEAETRHFSRIEEEIHRIERDAEERAVTNKLEEARARFESLRDWDDATEEDRLRAMGALTISEEQTAPPIRTIHTQPVMRRAVVMEFVHLTLF
jgi:hypothetical protein